MPEHELVLLLAGTAAARARHHERLLELTAGVDFAALEAFLRKQGMLALIGRRLQQAVTGGLPDRFGEQLSDHVRLARRQGVHQQMLTVRLMSALEAAGIRVLPLKGPLLGERLYDDLGARISSDVDLLVAERDLAGAVEIVAELGYRRHPAACSRRRGRPTLHERLVHPAELPTVELHWRVHWYEDRFSADLLARSAPGPGGCLVPRPLDELTELLLLYARDGFAGLRLVTDVGAWWDRYGSELGADGIAEAALRYPATARALATATLLAERLVGLPASQVLAAAAPPQRSRAALRLVNWPLRGSPAQVSANVSLVDWLLAPPGQWWALVRRHLLPDRQELLNSRPAPSPDGPRMLGLRILHLVRVLGRYAIATGSVLRRGTWAPLPPSLGGSNGR